MGNQIFLTVMSLSLSGTLIGILILCIRPLTKRVFSKKWNYYVWLVMVARLLLPVSLGINLVGSLFAVGNEWGSVAAGISVRKEAQDGERELRSEGALGREIENAEDILANEGLPDEGKMPDGVIPEPADSQVKNYSPAIADGEQPMPFLPYLWVIWLFGVFLSAGIKVNDYRNFAAYVKVGRREITEGEVRELADELSERLGIKKIVKVYESPLITGPILIGVFHPGIIFPKDTVGQNGVSLILHHELTHYKKKDLWYKWLYQAVLCIHWFNPFLYLIGRKLNTDCELACDEAVMEDLTVEGRKAYGNVLLDAAEHKLSFKKSVFSTTLVEDKGTLKERLNAILHYKKTKGILIVLSIVLLAIIMVLAGFAGARNSRIHHRSQPPREYVSLWDDASAEYASLWDDASAGYVSLWDGFGSAVGEMWDGIGQMWGSLGEVLSDAMSITGVKAGETIWGYFNDLDQFLAQTASFDTHGEAWKLYEDDALIAGEDLNDRWQAYSYMGGGERIKCKGLVLNGSDTYEILYAQKGFPQKLEFEAELKSGRMKLVHVGADGTVTLLAELEEGDSFNDTVSIPLTEGRNTVKIVGQGAKIKQLSLKFENKNNKNILKLFRSETEEVAGQIRDEFQKGNISVDRFMDILPYMEDDDLYECAKILFDHGVNLTIDQITDLIVYGDDRVGVYLVDAVEKGTMRPFTGEEIVGNLIYYISSADTLRLVENMNEPLDFDVLKDILIYLEGVDREKCLDIYLKQGKELSYEEFSEIYYYLDESVIKRVFEKR